MEDRVEENNQTESRDRSARESRRSWSRFIWKRKQIAATNNKLGISSPIQSGSFHRGHFGCRAMTSPYAAKSMVAIIPGTKSHEANFEWALASRDSHASIASGVR